MYLGCCFDCFSWPINWTAVGALTAIFAAATGTAAIVYFGYQMHLQVFLKLQEIFTANDFTKARGRVFQLLNEDYLANEEICIKKYSFRDDDIIKDFKTVCRRMDEFCHLTPFYLRRRLIKYWWNPIGKSWGLLHYFVELERETTNWPKKWEAFEKIGRKCLKGFPSRLPPSTNIDFEFEIRAERIRILCEKKYHKTKESTKY